MVLARVLRVGTLEEQGVALMKHYAPALTLDCRLLGGRQPGAWYDPNKHEIKWPMADGLTVLLHELGHYRLKHDSLYATKDTGRSELWEEVTAWLWAENEAKKLGILLDYKLAEHYFNRKKWNKRTGGPLVKINWRYINVLLRKRDVVPLH